jgi:hypothetical protein
MWTGLSSLNRCSVDAQGGKGVRHCGGVDSVNDSVDTGCERPV